MSGETLTQRERADLERGWVERDFTGIRHAVEQIVADRVAALTADLAAARAERDAAQAQGAAVQAYVDQCAILRVEPSTGGLRAALDQPGQDGDR